MLTPGDFASDILALLGALQEERGLIFFFFFAAFCLGHCWRENNKLDGPFFCSGMAAMICLLITSSVQGPVQNMEEEM